MKRTQPTSPRDEDKKSVASETLEHRGLENGPAGITDERAESTSETPNDFSYPEDDERFVKNRNKKLVEGRQDFPSLAQSPFDEKPADAEQVNVQNDDDPVCQVNGLLSLPGLKETKFSISLGELKRRMNSPETLTRVEMISYVRQAKSAGRTLLDSHNIVTANRSHPTVLSRVCESEAQVLADGILKMNKEYMPMAFLARKTVNAYKDDGCRVDNCEDCRLKLRRRIVDVEITRWVSRISSRQVSNLYSPPTASPVARARNLRMPNEAKPARSRNFAHSRCVTCVRDPQVSVLAGWRICYISTMRLKSLKVQWMVRKWSLFHSSPRGHFPVHIKEGRNVKSFSWISVFIHIKRRNNYTMAYISHLDSLPLLNAEDVSIWNLFVSFKSQYFSFSCQWPSFNASCFISAEILWKSCRKLLNKQRKNPPSRHLTSLLTHLEFQTFATIWLCLMIILDFFCWHYKMSNSNVARKTSRSKRTSCCANGDLARTTAKSNENIRNLHI